MYYFGHYILRFQCNCCKLSNDLKIVSTLPDVSIVYKLHLEGGKFINMYDWLQAFAIIVNPSNNDEELANIDPKYQYPLIYITFCIEKFLLWVLNLSCFFPEPFSQSSVCQGCSRTRISRFRKELAKKNRPRSTTDMGMLLNCCLLF